LPSDEATGLLKVITDYSCALDILDQYDHQVLGIEGTSDQQLLIATYEEAIQAITDLKNKLVAVLYSAMKKMIRSKNRSEQFINPLEVLNFIQQ
jgi:hypothetical protein